MGTGMAEFVLLVAAIAIALVVLLVFAVAGMRVGVRLVIALLLAFAAFLVWAWFEDALRSKRAAIAMHAYELGCTRIAQDIFQTAKGDEPIYIRMSGQDKVPDSFRILPSKKLPDGVQLLGDRQQIEPNAIVVDAVYTRADIPGAGRRRQITSELTVTHAQGQRLAFQRDVEEHYGFCLGEPDLFLSRVLARPSVLGHYRDKNTILPDVIVHARLSPPRAGLFSLPPNSTTKAERQRQLQAEGASIAELSQCRVSYNGFSDPRLECGEGERAISLRMPARALQLEQSWLFVEEVWGASVDTQLQVEQRSMHELRLLRTWRIVFPPPVGPGKRWTRDIKRLRWDKQQLSMDVLSLDSKGRNYTTQQSMHAPLPGLRTP